MPGARMTLIVVALPAEAKPLIAHLALKRLQPDFGFPVYRGDRLALVVSGPGKTSAAAATAHVHAVCGFPAQSIWLNLGVAGHAALPLGEAFLAQPITDSSTRRVWHPPLAFAPPCRTMPLTTYDLPVADYPDDTACDMEGAGFFPVATRFSTSELVQCLKVISDNPQSPASELNARRVRQLIADRMSIVDTLIRRLDVLADRLAAMELPQGIVARYTSRWHFTTEQERHLKSLLCRWRALSIEADLWTDELEPLANARAVLEGLENHIGALARGSPPWT